MATIKRPTDNDDSDKKRARYNNGDDDDMENEWCEEDSMVDDNKEALIGLFDLIFFVRFCVCVCLKHLINTLNLFYRQRTRTV
jgi:hypothetical protein